MSFLYGYLLIINLAAFAIMGWDKIQARKRGRRVPEARLFLTSAIGGSLGIWMGMHAFRHKTKHRSFQIGIPVLLFLNVVIIVFIFMKWNDL